MLVTRRCTGDLTNSTPPPRLFHQLRAAARAGHYTLATEKASVRWARAFIRLHGLRHPIQVGGTGGVRVFLGGPVFGMHWAACGHEPSGTPPRASGRSLQGSARRGPTTSRWSAAVAAGWPVRARGQAVASQSQPDRVARVGPGLPLGGSAGPAGVRRCRATGREPADVGERGAGQKRSRARGDRPVHPVRASAVRGSQRGPRCSASVPCTSARRAASSSTGCSSRLCSRIACSSSREVFDVAASACGSL